MPPELTLADLATLAQADSTLPETRRRDVASDLRTFAREGGRQPAAVPATVDAARELIQAMRRQPLGVSRKRWANIRANVGFALARYRGVPEQHWESGRQLQGPWLELRNAITENEEGVRIQLSRLFRYFNLMDIAPEQVSTATFAAFRDWLVTSTLVTDPAWLFRRISVAWNRAVDTVPGWPQVRVAVETHSTKYAMPELLPASFRADVEAWRAILASTDPVDDNAPLRPLRPASVKHMVGTVYRFAAGMVLQGVPSDKLHRMADLFQPAYFKLGLRFQLARHGGQPSPGITQMTDVLLGAARHWAHVDSAHYKLLQRDAKRIECRQSGLTPTNRQRLAQFDDPGNVLVLMNLPGKLLELAGRRPRHDRDGALLAQMAVAILILLVTAVRLRNLTYCHLDRNIVRNASGRRQPIRLVFERDEVKNRQVLDTPIPEVLARALELYIVRYRPLLLGAQDKGWLFPGRLDQPKAKEVLGRQITKTVRQHTGLVINVHLFRHTAALLLDQVDPGNYEQIRLLLGHLSLDTTTKFYTGFATDRAARRYHEQVLGQMTKGPKRRAS